MTTKTKARHTPGPWRIYPDRISPIQLSIYANDKRVASVADASPENTRLIAAAPELLESLQAFAEQYQKISGHSLVASSFSGVAVLARTVIAKATGEEV